MPIPIFVTVPAELVFAFSAGHMLASSILPNTNLALRTFLCQELQEELSFQLGEEVLNTEVGFPFSVTEPTFKIFQASI